VSDTLDVPGVGRIRVSMVDAANACVFARAEDIGLDGTEMPQALERTPEAMGKLAAIRVAASVAMGIARDAAEAARKKAVPFVGFVSAPRNAVALTGETIEAAGVDLTARMISNGQPHQALPLTASLCIAVAARLEASVVHEAARRTDDPKAALRIAMPSGILTVAASVSRTGGEWHAEEGVFYRTQRRLFEGSVLVREALA
jgi:2-methylaconitate cis-trans-isomerase PrpF